MTDSGSGIPFLTGGNLKDGKLSLDGASYITPEKHSKLTSGHLLEDDIVIAVRGSLGALGYVNTDNSGWNINSQLAILRTDKSELYGKFLIQYLLSWTGQNELLKRQTGSALKQLPIGAIKDVEVPITSIAEQGKIGEYFSNLDNLITLHQRKCDETKELKKFMLQKMFPKNGEKKPEIRFEGFTDDWEQRKLSDIVDVLDGDRGKNYPKETDFDTNGHTLFLNASNVTTDGFSFDTNQFISEEKSDSMGNGKLIDDDIVITSRGSLGHIAWYSADIQRIVPYVRINSGMLILRKKVSINTSYLYQFMKSDKGQNQISFMSFGSAQPQLTKKGIEGLNVNYPKKSKEQAKIGEYFSNLDNLITLHQRKLEKLKMIKRLLLEKMFI